MASVGSVALSMTICQIGEIASPTLRKEKAVPRQFRFGLVDAPFGFGAPTFGSVRGWTDRTRRGEDLGFATLLVPDGPKRFSAFQSLAAVAAVTDQLRLGTFVLPVPFWSPSIVAWETASLDQLSGGRFELGLGAGHPGNAESAEALGMPYGTPGQRIRQVGETIAAVNRLASETIAAAVQQPRPPIMVAGSGDQLLAFAAGKADIIHMHLHGTERMLAEKVVASPWSGPPPRADAVDCHLPRETSGRYRHTNKRLELLGVGEGRHDVLAHEPGPERPHPLGRAGVAGVARVEAVHIPRRPWRGLGKHIVRSGFSRAARYSHSVIDTSEPAGAPGGGFAGGAWGIYP
jgi:hypothetical protein